ncbi:hypothetical protein [Flavobacterium sp. 3HN19-14]|uniref:hypothetical protein n=1 Tax=Flavobacterium sp. 3HN19-14 TaxID=3448133 RepID=UPI003EE32A4C
MCLWCEQQQCQLGPLRVGVFATGSSGRASAGAGYYGVMELGGNVLETVITAATAGIGFTGALGDGNILANGDANVSSWPSLTTASGAGHRGGDWVEAAGKVRTSDRSAAAAYDAARSYVYGGRGVR